MFSPPQVFETFHTERERPYTYLPTLRRSYYKILPAAIMADEDVANESQTITIKVKDGAGEELQFKVKKTTRMEKIFESYAGKKGISSASLRFSLDGEKINPDATPKMLELEDNDQIDGTLFGCIPNHTLV